MPNIDLGDGRIYDPVSEGDYSERPYEEAKDERPDEFSTVTYVDPEHHHSGDMRTTADFGDEGEFIREQLTIQASRLGVKVTKNMKIEVIEEKLAEAREVARDEITGAVVMAPVTRTVPDEAEVVEVSENES